MVAIQLDRLESNGIVENQKKRKVLILAWRSGYSFNIPLTLAVSTNSCRILLITMIYISLVCAYVGRDSRGFDHYYAGDQASFQHLLGDGSQFFGVELITLHSDHQMVWRKHFLS